MSDVPVTFLMRPKKPGDGDPGKGKEAPPSPPGKAFFILLTVLTLLACIAVVLFFDEFTQQRLLDYGSPGPGGPDRTYSWMRNNFFTTIFLGLSGMGLFAGGFISAAFFLLARHLPKGNIFLFPVLTILGAVTAFLGLCYGESARYHVPVFALFLVISALALARSPGRPLRRIEWLSLAYLVTLFVAAIGAGAMSYRIGRAIAGSYDRAIERGNTIIEALAEYNEDQGDYPEELEELVPEYLPEIPSTGMAGSPNYSYSRDPDISEHYVLAIHLPRDQSGLNWYDLWYWPEQDYDNPDKPKVYNLLSRHRMDGWLYTYGGT